MKEIKYKCDKCGKEWDLRFDPSAYVLEHISLTGRPIMGDNRMNEQKQFCPECFDRYLAPILAQEKEIK